MLIHRTDYGNRGGKLCLICHENKTYLYIEDDVHGETFEDLLEEGSADKIFETIKEDLREIKHKTYRNLKEDFLENLETYGRV